MLVFCTIDSIFSPVATPPTHFTPCYTTHLAASRTPAFQMEKDENQIFTLLVEAFGDADSSGVALVTNLIVFFNTILSSAFEFEDRVVLRSEMVQAGVVEAMQRIRDYYSLPRVRLRGEGVGRACLPCGSLYMDLASDQSHLGLGAASDENQVGLLLRCRTSLNKTRALLCRAS